MSNAVDILAVGGTHNGRQWCMQRAQMTTYIEAQAEGFGIVRYIRQQWEHPDTLKLYHIATPEGETVTSEQILAEIESANFQPAWDLNR